MTPTEHRYRFSGSTPRVLIVTLPDKSPGVIPLDSRTRLDEIYNSKKAFNDIKEVLTECLLLFMGALPGIIWKSLLDTRSLSFSDIYLDFIKSPLTLSTPTNKDRLSGSSPTSKDKLSGSTPANNNKHSGSTSSCDYILSGSYIFPQFVSKNLVGSPLVIDMVVQR